jgi:predicted transposase YbfD/YdcC
MTLLRTPLSTQIQNTPEKKTFITESTVEYETTITTHFHQLKDPRKAGMIQHKLLYIITITVCAVLCGADDWVGVETIAKSKKSFFRSFMELPNGIPSHDTFNNVFRCLSATQLQSCFSEWVNELVTLEYGDIVAIDGKTLRRSYDRQSGKGAIHMVSAWAQRQKMVLGQIKTEEKSNEITAIPTLLKMLDIKGCIVTIDAMGCQRKIARTILDREADYVLALKGNQGKLHKEVEAFFDDAIKTDFKDIEHDYHQTVDGGHGRVEVRRYWTVEDLHWLTQANKWSGLTSVGIVESERHIEGEITIERRCFISSLSSNAKRFGEAVRGHWSIENDLHWSLDVSFNEDQCRVRKGEGAENFAVIRHIALNLLKQELSAKVGIRNKRLKAASNDEYLLKVLMSE